MFTLLSAKQLYAAAGTFAIEPKYEAAGLFNEGIAPVGPAGKWGFIKPDRIWAIEPRYNELKPNRGGAVVFSDDVAWELADKSGKVVSELRFSDMTSASEGFAGFSNASGKWAIGSIDGALLFDLMFEAPPPEVFERKAAVKKDSVWGFVDGARAKEFVPIKGVDQFFSFSDGRAAFIKGKLRGFVDETEKVIVKAQFQRIRAYSNDYAAV